METKVSPHRYANRKMTVERSSTGQRYSSHNLLFYSTSSVLCLIGRVEKESKYTYTQLRTKCMDMYLWEGTQKF